MNTNSNGRFFIYLTDWGYTLCTVQSVLSVVMMTSSLVTHKRRKHVDDDSITRSLYKVYWVINEVATGSAFAITVLFWALIYEGMCNSLVEVKLS